VRRAARGEHDCGSCENNCNKLFHGSLLVHSQAAGACGSAPLALPIVGIVTITSGFGFGWGARSKALQRGPKRQLGAATWIKQKRLRGCNSRGDEVRCES
jgi:hypothetical protein